MVLIDDFIKNPEMGDTIRAKYLQHIQKMKDCPSWDKVMFLGRVKYEFQHSKMDGGIIRWNGKNFYINIQQIMVLANLYKWNTNKIIKVINEE